MHRVIIKGICYVVVVAICAACGTSAEVAILSGIAAILLGSENV